jgi:hypothetical protein
MTQTQELLTQVEYRGFDVTHAEAFAAGGEVYERSANYTKYLMPDGSRIAIPHIPFANERAA